MGDLRQDDDYLSRRRPTLRREARIPLQFSRRPCLLVGITMATVFFAAGVDSFIRQQSAEPTYRDDSAQIYFEQVREVEALQLEIEVLELELAGANYRLGEQCESLATADVGTLRFYLERAVLRGDWGSSKPEWVDGKWAYVPTDW